MADALDKIRAGLDKARTKLAKQRLGGRDHVVKLRTMTVVDAVPDAGDPGTQTPVDVTVSPTPSVVLGDVYRWENGGVSHRGDAEVRKISRLAYTEAVLLSADSWVIDDVEFTLVEGSLKTLPTEFRAILKRRETLEG